jgi:hypothetical protein
MGVALLLQFLLEMRELLVEAVLEREVGYFVGHG